MEQIIRHGLCWCGCGFFAPIAKETRSKHFRVKGEPVRYITGHQSRIRPVVEEAVPFKIDGVYCRLIPLTQGLWAIVDESDYLWLMQWKWFAHYAPNTQSYYAARMERSPDGKQRVVHMHRFILGLERDDPRKGDHRRNKCGIDNRRKNLRPADDDENAQNASVRKDNTSGTRGMSWLKRLQAWQVEIQYRKVRKYVGVFKDFEKAKAARLKAALELHKEFACLD